MSRGRFLRRHRHRRRLLLNLFGDQVLILGLDVALTRCLRRSTTRLLEVRRCVVSEGDSTLLNLALLSLQELILSRVGGLTYAHEAKLLRCCVRRALCADFLTHAKSSEAIRAHGPTELTHCLRLRYLRLLEHLLSGSAR